MYRYNEVDKRLVRSRVAEFRDQVRRRLAGELAEEDFLPLRLMNGLYHQRHSYMLRIGIPYGLISSDQMRAFGVIAEKYDRDYGHFTTRQNIQFNWVKLEEVADILAVLADVEMHAIQTSGNCVRNVTCDPFAGVAPDEIVDPRPLAEMLRQYKELHPEFLYLPRKFKIAMTGAPDDRAATRFHDIGIQGRVRDGVVGWRILVGGGMGRTPRIAQEIHPFLPAEDALSYVEAILRVYNLHGRRDNKYKARIKILVGDLGIDRFREEVEREWEPIRHRKMDMDEYARIRRYFERDVTYEDDADLHQDHLARKDADPVFARWLHANVKAHREPGYHMVTLSLKAPGVAPGDISTAQFHAVADLMDRTSQSRCTATYNQNLVFPHVRSADLEALHGALDALGLATPNVDTAADQICCPGLDFCNLASASSIPLAQSLSERFSDPVEIQDLGQIHINMSGCVNACGHHHTGHIGILGVDKHGEEFFQIAVGGHAGSGETLPPSIAQVVGPAVTAEEAVHVIDRMLDRYRDERESSETFLQTVRRVGIDSFKEAARG